MSRPKRDAHRFALFVLAASLATTAAAETHSIGTLGATLPVGSWERVRVSESLGDDQFAQVDRNLFMVVFEDFDLYEERADFVAGLDQFLAASLRLAELEVAQEVDYERSADFTRMTRWLTGTVSSMELGYRFDLISAGDGVGYLIMSWSPLRDFEILDQEVGELLRGLRLPGPDSEWGERATPSVHAYRFDDWTVELTFRDSVFTEGDSNPGERYTLMASGGEQVLHVFLDELEGDADEVLDEVKEIASENDDYEELSRTDLDLEAGQGRQLLLRSDGRPATDLAIAVVGVGEDRWIDLRMVSVEAAGIRDPLWQGLLRSIRVIPPAEVDAFPVVEEAEDEVAGHLEPATRRLLEASDPLGSHAAQILGVRDDGRLLVLGDGRLELRPASGSDGGSAEVLYDSDGYMAGTYVVWGERAFFVGAGGEVSAVDGEGKRPAGFDADVMAAAGDELLLARNGRRERLLGFTERPAVGDARVFVRGEDGEERLLAELPGVDVQALARRPGGEVLIATAPRAAFTSAGEGPTWRLVLVGARGRSREIARWEAVDRLEPAPGGWLVTGTPESGKKGVHRVGDDGGSELLLSGDPVGLALSEDELTFATDSCLEPSGGYYTYCAFRAGLDRVRELGPSFQPFTAAVLNQIGERMLPRPESASTDGFPATRDALSAFLAEAGEIALELTGAELPSSAGGIDGLLSDLAFDRDLTEPTIVLLSVMLAESLLEDGAVWVPTDEPEPASRNTVEWEIENPFAVGLHPVATVFSTLYLEEGWYGPAVLVGGRAEGRTVVLGLDTESVRARVRAAEVPELEALVREARVERLAEVLDRQPENARLRTAVYEHLAGHGHHDAIVELAERYVSGDDPEGVDLRAWMAGRLAEELSPEQVAEAIADLRDAIERAPDDAGLYLLLGSAYERSEEPERVALAGASYRKARDTAGWGPVHQTAQDLLEELDDEE